MNKTPLKILFLAAESRPWVKVGGLADVVASLPPALQSAGTEVLTIIPKYRDLPWPSYLEHAVTMTVSVGNKEHECVLWRLATNGPRVYVLECDDYFSGAIYDGNCPEKFLFFSHAALLVLPYLDWRPDIIHCHDYHTALVPLLVKSIDSPFYQDVKTVFTIHNLDYQGVSGPEVLSTANLRPEMNDILARDAADGDLNFMTQGILGADVVTTVSPTYAKEILESTYGAGLEKVVRMRASRLFGILNGLDEDFYNPSHDRLLPARFSAQDLAGKRECRQALIKECGWEDDGRPVVAVVSRLAWQKGIDLFGPEFLKLDARFVILGKGDAKISANIAALTAQAPRQFHFFENFSEELAHRLYAGADIFFMPSRFEPCGLGQMIAMRYGTLPVVRETGGLRDTVDRRSGWLFQEFSVAAACQALRKASEAYHDQAHWHDRQLRAMNKDFSWKHSAEKYIHLYKSLKKTVDKYSENESKI